jgi:hypothetical protein
MCTFGAGNGWVVSATLQPLYPREKPGTHCTEGWMGLGANLDGTENIAFIEIRSPDRPARSESLYRMRYAGRHSLILPP